MRKALLVLMAGVWLVSFAQAAPPACVSGTLASYIALGTGGCTAGTVTLADFAYAAKAGGGAPKIPASQIQVTPVFAIPSTGGLTFSAKWGVSPGQTQESIIKYTAVGHATSSGILMLQLGTHQAGTGGSVAVNETTTAGRLQVYETCLKTCKSVDSATLPFTPSTVPLLVTDDVKLTAGTVAETLASFTATINFCAPCV